MEKKMTVDSCLRERFDKLREPEVRAAFNIRSILRLLPILRYGALNCIHSIPDLQEGQSDRF